MTRVIRLGEADQGLLDALLKLLLSPVLPGAPAHATTADIDAYLDGEPHQCALCGATAREVFAAGASSLVPRACWLDVCRSCSSRVRRLFAYWPGDETAVSRARELGLL
jgi:hypothetical protein